MKPIATLPCSPDLAVRLGARVVPVIDGGTIHPGCMAFLRLRAADAISAAGEIPILARGGGPVLAWPVVSGARDSGAGR